METSLNEETQHNAIGRGVESIDYTEKQWGDFVNDDLESFSGNKENAARLLFQLCKGVRYVRDKLRGKGLKIETVPIPAVLVDEKGVDTPILRVPGFILVKKSFLEEYSEFDMDAIYTVARADGEVAFEGKIPSLFRLAGVEEFHHEVFGQYKGNVEEPLSPLTQSIADYDSQEHEYKALRWQVRHALETGIDSVTIDKLQNRLLSAKLSRERDNAKKMKKNE